MTTIPAYTIGGLTRPELFLDPNGNIVLTPAAQAFADQYGLKALYLGCPPGTPWPPVTGLLLTTPIDTEAGANSVLEGATTNTPVHITAEAHDIVGFPITYSLTADSSGGGFQINSTTGVVTVADGSKINFEANSAHSYTLTVRASDGIFTSSQTFTIDVGNVNEAPSGTSKTVATTEDHAYAFTIADFGFTDPDIYSSNSLLAVKITTVPPGATLTNNGNPVAAGDFVSVADITAGHLVYTPPANASGSPLAAFTFQVQDNGGTANGGHDLDPAAKTMTINVASVNDAPSFTAGANQTVLEDSGAHTVNGFATGISPGPADEAGQAVNFLVTTNNDALFSVVPSIDTNGNLTYTLAANAFGTATVTVRAHDNGGTANGGVDTSAGQTFTVTVTGVNDAPSFTVGPDQAAPEDSGAHTVNGFAGSISAGPNETGQALNFIVSNNNNALFSVQPSIDASGNLTYTPAANANGSATVSVALHDDGGTANGGVDTSAVQTFTINVPAVNDVPSFTVGADQITLEDSGAHTVNGFVTAISAGPADEAGQLVNFIVSNDNNAMFSVQPSIDASGNLTYTLAANANGNAVVSVQAHDNGGTANGGVDTSAAQTFNIAATAVNDAPVGTSTAVTILEDQTHTFTAAEFGFTDPADAASGTANTLLNLIITTLPGAGAGTLMLSGVPVVAGQSVAAANIGNLVFTPAANANGSPEASFTFQVQDNGGTANGGVDTDPAPKTFTFNVTPVNDAPDGTDKTIGSQGAHTFAAADFGFTDPLDSPANSLFAVEITTLPALGSLALNGAAVTAGQFISATDIASGLLVFTPSGNNPGSFTFQVQDNGGVANGGVDLDPTPNTLTVIQNTAPVANDDSVSATEAGGLNNAVAGVNPTGNVILGTGAAGSVQDTDAEDASNALTVVAVHTGPEGGSVLTGTVGAALTGSHGQLTLNNDGSYSYAVNQTDSAVQALHTSAETITDVFNYTIQDTGGLQDTATLTITIRGADDLPGAVADTGTMTEDDAPALFNVIANDSQDPDHTATNAITVGPSGVTVTGPAGETFANTDATASIVSNQIQVSLTNSHFQQLALGEHATVTVPYTLTGDAGETSTTNLVVTVNGVNDVPVAVDDSGSMTEDQVGTFTVLTNDTLDADHGAPNNVTTGAISNLTAPSGENIDVSDIGLSVNGSNQVVVTLGSDFQYMHDGETATFDVAYTLHGDQPGDTSTATLHVTVNGANDAPVAANFTFNGANAAIGNTDLVVNDPADAAPDPAGPQKTISASLLGGASDVDGPGPLVVVAGAIATANGGTVTMQADGDFTYKPAVGFTGNDSFTYTVSDQNPGVAGTGTGTVTINVAAPHVWYVNADAASDGDGSSENPYNTLSHFAGVGGVDAAGDTIVLENSTAHYTGGLTLENNEQLISQSAGVTINGTTLFAASGANAVVDGGVVLGSGNTIEGVDFGTSAGFAISGSSVGTLHIDDTKAGVINNASGGGISIAGSANVLNVDFTSITSGAGTNGIALTNSSGTFQSHGGTISGASGADIALNGGTVNFTQDGGISDATGTAVSIANMTGGTQDFNGAITGAVVSLTSNTGATMSFDGGMTLTAGASNAFSATGGGTVTVTGTNNHLTTTTGTALNVANTTIGSNGLTFHDISANGAVNGIVLNNTGTSGHLTVTGTGTTAGSGGTIQNTTGDAVSLTSTQDVNLNNMNITGSQGNGIFGNGVNGIVLSHLNVTGNGNSTTGDGEGNIYLYELTGSASHLTTFDSLNVTNSYVHNVFVKNTGGTLADLVVTNSTFSNNGASTHAGDEFQIDLTTGGLAGTPTATVHATHNTFSGNLSTPANFTATGFAGSVDEGTLNVHLGDGTAGGLNTFDTNNSGITLTQTGSASLNFDVNDNIVTHNRAVGVAINHFDTGTVTGFLRNTTIGTQGQVHSGAEIGNGVDIHDESVSGSMTLSVTNNVVQSVGDGAGSGFEGILVQSGNGAQNSASTINLTLTGNTIRDILDDRGLFINDFNTAGASTINALVSGNTFSNADAGGGNTTARIGGAPAGTDHVNVTQADANALAAANGLTASAAPGSTMRVDTNVFFNHAAPPAPPVTPQMALHGQGPGGADQLTIDALAPVLAAAIQHWADAGASAAQIALLQHANLKIADLPNSGFLADTDANGITIDTDGAGWGWFIDPTPSDNSEFHATASPSELIATSGNAANHIDLLTAVEHELGHILGLPDSGQTGVMNSALDSGERRLPDTADVAGAPAVIQQTQPQQNTPAPAPVASTAPAESFGGGIAQNFAFAQFNPTAPTLLPGAVAPLFKGDGFDFSTSQFHKFAAALSVPDSQATLAHSGDAALLGPLFGGGHLEGWASHLDQFHFGLLT